MWTTRAALAVLVAAAGCSATDGDGGTVAVPSPGPAATKLCRELDRALPERVAGLDRADPSPDSVLTAGWESPSVVLRCGVAQPPKMVDPRVAEGKDPDAVAGGVNGVDWLMEKADEGAHRFTTARRRVYVEVRVAAGQDTSAVLVDLAPAIKRAVPEGIADQAG